MTSAGQLFRRIGGTIGTAAFGIMMTTRSASEMNAGLAQIDPGLLDSVPLGLIAQILDNPQRLSTVGPVPLAAMVVNFWLPEARLRDSWDEPPSD